MLANLKPEHVLLVLFVVLLLFGTKRLPDLAKSVGKSLKILKSEVKDLRDDDHPSPDNHPLPAASTAAIVDPTATPPVSVPVVAAQPAVAPVLGTPGTDSALGGRALSAGDEPSRLV